MGLPYYVLFHPARGFLDREISRLPIGGGALKRQLPFPIGHSAGKPFFTSPAGGVRVIDYHRQYQGIADCADGRGQRAAGPRSECWQRHRPLRTGAARQRLSAPATQDVVRGTNSADPAPRYPRPSAPDMDAS